MKHALDSDHCLPGFSDVSRISDYQVELSIHSSQVLQSASPQIVENPHEVPQRQ